MHLSAQIKMDTFMEISPCLGVIMVSLLSYQLISLLEPSSMHPPAQLAFALTCGGVALLLLWKEKKAIAEAEKRVLERRKLLNGREKKTPPPSKPRRKSSTESLFLDSAQPISASKLKFIPTPIVETFPIEITRPLRPSIKQQAFSKRPAGCRRVQKPILTRRDFPKPVGAANEWNTLTAQPKPQPETAPLPRIVSSPKPMPSPKRVPSPKTVSTPMAVTPPKVAPQLTTQLPPGGIPSPKPAPALQTDPDSSGMESPPLQATSAATSKQINEVHNRRRSSNFAFPPKVAAQLCNLDPHGASPELVYDAICDCLERASITQPSPFHIHMALSLLKRDPDQEFYDYINFKQAEQMQYDIPNGDDLPGRFQPRSALKNHQNINDSHTEEVIPLMSGAVQPADSRILDPQTRRRPRYIVPDNDSTVCDKSLSFDQQVQIQPYRLLSKREILEMLSFEPQRCLHYVPDEYYTTNLGLSIIIQKIREATERVLARLHLASTESEQASVLQEYEREVVLWVIRFGGRFNDSQKIYRERGAVRYADDLVPYTNDGTESSEWTEEEQQYWGDLWGRATHFWSSVGFDGEYDGHGYIPENESVGGKIWQAHLLWERDRTRGRMPRTIFLKDSK